MDAPQNANGPGIEIPGRSWLCPSVASESGSPQSFQPIIGFVQCDQFFLTLVPEQARSGHGRNGQQTHTKNANCDLPVKWTDTI